MDLRIEPSKNCEFDRVSIYDGKDEKAALMRNFCGETPPEYLRSTGRFLTIIMRSDQSESLQGFKIDYKTLPGCGEKLTAPFGYIKSPDYPGKYPSNSNCKYWIRTPFGKSTVIEFEDFELEDLMYGECFDYVSIHEVLYEKSKSLGRFCGSNRPRQFCISSKHVLFQFVSDQALNFGGFKAKYWVQDGNCNNPVKMAISKSPMRKGQKGDPGKIDKGIPVSLKGESGHKGVDLESHDFIPQTFKGILKSGNERKAMQALPDFRHMLQPTESSFHPPTFPKLSENDSKGFPDVISSIEDDDSSGLLPSILTETINVQQILNSKESKPLASFTETSSVIFVNNGSSRLEVSQSEHTKETKANGHILMEILPTKTQNLKFVGKTSLLKHREDRIYSRKSDGIKFSANFLKGANRYPKGDIRVSDRRPFPSESRVLRHNIFVQGYSKPSTKSAVSSPRGPISSSLFHLQSNLKTTSSPTEESGSQVKKSAYFFTYDNENLSRTRYLEEQVQATLEHSVMRSKYYSGTTAHAGEPLSDRRDKTRAVRFYTSPSIPSPTNSSTTESTRSQLKNLESVTELKHTNVFSSKKVNIETKSSEGRHLGTSKMGREAKSTSIKEVQKSVSYSKRSAAWKRSTSFGKSSSTIFILPSVLYGSKTQTSVSIQPTPSLETVAKGKTTMTKGHYSVPSSTIGKLVSVNTPSNAPVTSFQTVVEAIKTEIMETSEFTLTAKETIAFSSRTNSEYSFTYHKESVPENSVPSRTPRHHSISSKSTSELSQHVEASSNIAVISTKSFSSEAGILPVVSHSSRSKIKYSTPTTTNYGFRTSRSENATQTKPVVPMSDFSGTQNISMAVTQSKHLISDTIRGSYVHSSHVMSSQVAPSTSGILSKSFIYPSIPITISLYPTAHSVMPPSPSTKKFHSKITPQHSKMSVLASSREHTLEYHSSQHTMTKLNTLQSGTPSAISRSKASLKFKTESPASNSMQWHFSCSESRCLAPSSTYLLSNVATKSIYNSKLLTSVLVQSGHIKSSLSVAGSSIHSGELITNSASYVHNSSIQQSSGANLPLRGSSFARKDKTATKIIPSGIPSFMASASLLRTVGQTGTPKPSEIQTRTLQSAVKSTTLKALTVGRTSSISSGVESLSISSRTERRSRNFSFFTSNHTSIQSSFHHFPQSRFSVASGAMTKISHQEKTAMRTKSLLSSQSINIYKSITRNTLDFVTKISDTRSVPTLVLFPSSLETASKSTKQTPLTTRTVTEHHRNQTISTDISKPNMSTHYINVNINISKSVIATVEPMSRHRKSKNQSVARTSYIMVVNSLSPGSFNAMFQSQGFQSLHFQTSLPTNTLSLRENASTKEYKESPTVLLPTLRPTVSEVSQTLTSIGPSKNTVSCQKHAFFNISGYDWLKYTPVQRAFLSSVLNSKITAYFTVKWPYDGFLGQIGFRQEGLVLQTEGERLWWLHLKEESDTSYPVITEIPSFDNISEDIEVIKTKFLGQRTFKWYLDEWSPSVVIEQTLCGNEGT